MKYKAQVCKAARNTVYGQMDIIPSISGLLRRSCPPAIPWLVISSVIRIPIKGFARWPFPHVGKEVLEAFPSSANSNLLSTIPEPRRIVRIVAALKHCCPRLVCRVSAAIFFPSVIVRDATYFDLAATRLSSPMDYTLVTCLKNLSTVAMTENLRNAVALGVSVWRKIRDHFKLSKSKSDEALFFRHGIRSFVDNAVSAVGDRRQPALTAILN